MKNRKRKSKSWKPSMTLRVFDLGRCFDIIFPWSEPCTYSPTWWKNYLYPHQTFSGQSNCWNHCHYRLWRYWKLYRPRTHFSCWIPSSTTPETSESLQHGQNHQFQRKHRMGDSGRHSLQILKRKCPTHDIKPGTETGNSGNALAMKVESAGQLASKNLDYSPRNQPKGHCASMWEPPFWSWIYHPTEISVALARNGCRPKNYSKASKKGTMACWRNHRKNHHFYPDCPRNANPSSRSPRMVQRLLRCILRKDSWQTSSTLTL